MAFWKKTSPTPSSNLEERLAALESAQRRLDSDMDDLWSRFKRWSGRETKRAAIDAGSQAEPSPASRMDEINQQILALRRRNGVKP